MMLQRYLLTIVFAVIFACPSLVADEPTSVDATPVARKQEKQDLPLIRQIAGFGALGFLLVWLFIRNGGKSSKDNNGEERRTDDHDNPDL